ncbi:MAG: hypothetical protein ACR2L3_00670 [Actinomycetota bacterium]
MFAKPLTYVYRTALVAALAGLLSLSIGRGPSAPHLADVQGAGIGKDVARWLDKHYFRPTRP